MNIMIPNSLIKIYNSAVKEMSLSKLLNKLCMYPSAPITGRNINNLESFRVKKIAKMAFSFCVECPLNNYKQIKFLECNGLFKEL